MLRKEISVIRQYSYHFLAGKSGEELGPLVLHEKLMKALAADFLYMQVCHVCDMRHLRIFDEK